MKILEVDQWTSTGNIEDFTLADFVICDVRGGDSAAARKIFGGKAEVREVDEADRPPLGTAWFIEGDNGKLKRWKTNYDSSD